MRAVTEQIASDQARVAWRYLLLLLPMLAGVLVFEHYRGQLLGHGTAGRAGVAIALVIVGWTLAHQLGRALLPRLIAVIVGLAAQ